MTKELTPLEALWRLYKYPSLADKNVVAYLLEQDNLVTYHSIVEKALKALEIIKEKRVDVWAFIVSIYALTYKQYLKTNKCNQFAISEKNLTQEEFDLLKEYFK